LEAQAPESTPASLRPYGYLGGTYVAVGDDTKARLQAAREKLRLVSSGESGDEPIGTKSARNRLGLLVVRAIGVTWVAVVLVVYSNLFATLSKGGAGDPTDAVVLLILISFYYSTGAMLIVLSLVPRNRDTRADPWKDPRRVLNQFYWRVFSGYRLSALALLTNADKNDLPRIQPSGTGLGVPSGHPFRFSSDKDFGDYWYELLHVKTVASAQYRIKVIEQREVVPGLVAIRFQLKASTGSLLWIFATLPFPLISLIGVPMFYLARDRHRTEMQKLMVKVGDEWKLFNGEWQGYEELDLSWLDQPSN